MMNAIVSLDPTIIEKRTFEILDKVVKSKNFQPEKLKNINTVCGRYCEWVLVVHRYLRTQFPETPMMTYAEKQIMNQSSKNLMLPKRQLSQASSRKISTRSCSRSRMSSLESGDATIRRYPTKVPSGKTLKPLFDTPKVVKMKKYS